MSGEAEVQEKLENLNLSKYFSLIKCNRLDYFIL